MRTQFKHGNRKGNPYWGRPMIYRDTRPANLTEFERLILKLDLRTECDVVQNKDLVKWVYSNANKRYVPEWLLDRLGITPDVGHGGL